MAAILMAATLVVGTFATTTATTVFAASNNSGNTITIQKCKQAAIQSGWDNTQEQECENLICTHPGENATCVQEGVVVTPTPTPTPVKSPCEQCFTTLLTQAQITELVGRFDVSSLADLCALLEQSQFTEVGFRGDLTAVAGQTTANDLIACLLQAGIVFAPP